MPVSRTISSGTGVTFEQYVLKGVATIPGLGLDSASANGDVVQDVESNPGSIGYAQFYLASQAHDVTALSIDGQDPHNFSLIEHGAYRFWNIEHMYTRGAGSPLAQTFLSFIGSTTGEQLFPRFGFLPLSDVPQNIRQQHVLESQ